MKVAVLGAGFSGLAVAWYLLQNPKINVTVFDERGIGGGASGIAAGLLHKYAGAHAKLNDKADEALKAAKELLHVSEQALAKPIADYSGIMRIVTQPEQIADFQKCASKYSDVVWIDSPAALFIKDGITVNCLAYLQGLWKACHDRDAHLVIQKIHTLEDLKNFDCIVVCLGSSSNHLPELASIRLSKVKGQLLELEWPADLPPLKHTLNSYVYIAMSSPTTCIAGSTYERDYRTEGPDLEKAYELLLPKIVEMIPQLEHAKVLDCRAGIRVTTHNRIPLLKEVSPNVFLLTGLGSKGLLYHALFAQRCVEKICQRGYWFNFV